MSLVAGLRMNGDQKEPLESKDRKQQEVTDMCQTREGTLRRVTHESSSCA